MIARRIFHALQRIAPSALFTAARSRPARPRIAAGDPQTPVAQAIGVAFHDSIRFMEHLWQTQLTDPGELYGAFRDQFGRFQFQFSQGGFHASLC